MRKVKGVLVLIFLVFAIVGCKQQDEPSAPEKMYEHLEKAVELEVQFAEQQEPKITLAKQEEEIFNQIIDLKTSEMEKIKELSQEALTSIEQRREMLNTEKESIDAAKEEFDNVEQYIEDIGEEEVKEKANDLINAMETRYTAFVNYFNAYQTALDIDEELYNMFLDEELKQEKLDEQIENANLNYEEIEKYSEEFSVATNNYNQLKKEFYELAGIEVVYEK